MLTSLPQMSQIVNVVEESAKVRTLTLNLRWQAEPGQFVMAWLPGLDEKPFSLMNADPVTLTVARVGPFSEAIHRLHPGDPLWVRGPLGRPFSLPGRGGAGRHGAVGDITRQGALLMIAGGYGVAPLRFLAQQAREDGWPIIAVIGARTAAEVIFVDRFAALGARVLITTDDGSRGEQGLATDAATRLLDTTDCSMLYACGPEAMLEVVAALARAHRLPAQLSYERYMRCAFGVCGSCARGGWLVCRDGPVKPIDWRV